MQMRQEGALNVSPATGLLSVGHMQRNRDRLQIQTQTHHESRMRRALTNIIITINVKKLQFIR